jgi:hypothetical protein
VRFTPTIIDPEQPQVVELVSANLESLAAKADTQIENAEITMPSQAPATTLLDSVKIVEGAISQTEAAAAGTITLVQSVVDDLVSLTERSPDHGIYAAQDALVALWGGLQDAAEKLGENTARAVGNIITNNPTSLDAFARARGMTTEEAVSLNPGSLAGPEIPKGTLLKYYK